MLLLQRLVREICANFVYGMDLNGDAIVALQEATEAYLV